MHTIFCSTFVLTCFVRTSLGREQIFCTAFLWLSDYSWNLMAHLDYSHKPVTKELHQTLSQNTIFSTSRPRLRSLLPNGSSEDDRQPCYPDWSKRLNIAKLSYTAFVARFVSSSKECWLLCELLLIAEYQTRSGAVPSCYTAFSPCAARKSNSRDQFKLLQFYLYAS